MTFGTSQLFRTDSAASYLGVSKSTLAKMRMRGDGPRFVKLGSRIVAYRKSDLEDWLCESLRSATND